MQPTREDPRERTGPLFGSFSLRGSTSACSMDGPGYLLSLAVEWQAPWSFPNRPGERSNGTALRVQQGKQDAREDPGEEAEEARSSHGIRALMR